MRIKRDALMKVTQNTVSQRTRSNRNLLAVYLCGSLLKDEYLLGGTADIDLVFIHVDDVTQEREIVPVTDDIHLDIAHHRHRDYRQTRKLRIHPWLGPTVFGCQILYDPQHFMDFTQASVRGQYFRADYVLERARTQSDRARQIWMSFYREKPEPGSQEVAAYLKAVEHAANAAASLSGPPLTDRRFLLEFPRRAEAAGWPGLYPGMLGLLGASQLDADSISAWLPAWEAAYDALPAGSGPARLHPSRKTYYRAAFKALLKSEEPISAAWPLLRTWSEAINHLPEQASLREAWADAMRLLGLLGEGFGERVMALDAYLDMVEETLEKWGWANGIRAFP